MYKQPPGSPEYPSNTNCSQANTAEPGSPCYGRSIPGSPVSLFSDESSPQPNILDETDIYEQIIRRDITVKEHFEFIVRYNTLYSVSLQPETIINYYDEHLDELRMKFINGVKFDEKELNVEPQPLKDGQIIEKKEEEVYYNQTINFDEILCNALVIYCRDKQNSYDIDKNALYNIIHKCLETTSEFHNYIEQIDANKKKLIVPILDTDYLSYSDKVRYETLKYNSSDLEERLGYVSEKDGVVSLFDFKEYQDVYLPLFRAAEDAMCVALGLAKANQDGSISPIETGRLISNAATDCLNSVSQLFNAVIDLEYSPISDDHYHCEVKGGKKKQLKIVDNRRKYKGGGDSEYKTNFDKFISNKDSFCLKWVADNIHDFAKQVKRSKIMADWYNKSYSMETLLPTLLSEENLDDARSSIIYNSIPNKGAGGGFEAYILSLIKEEYENKAGDDHRRVDNILFDSTNKNVYPKQVGQEIQTLLSAEQFVYIYDMDSDESAEIRKNLPDVFKQYNNISKVWDPSSGSTVDKDPPVVDTVENYTMIYSSLFQMFIEKGFINGIDFDLTTGDVKNRISFNITNARGEREQFIFLDGGLGVKTSSRIMTNLYQMINQSKYYNNGKTNFRVVSSYDVIHKSTQGIRASVIIINIIKHMIDHIIDPFVFDREGNKDNRKIDIKYIKLLILFFLCMKSSGDHGIMESAKLLHEQNKEKNFVFAISGDALACAYGLMRGTNLMFSPTEENENNSGGKAKKSKGIISIYKGNEKFSLDDYVLSFFRRQKQYFPNLIQLLEEVNDEQRVKVMSYLQNFIVNKNEREYHQFDTIQNFNPIEDTITNEQEKKEIVIQRLKDLEYILFATYEFHHVIGALEGAYADLVGYIDRTKGIHKASQNGVRRSARSSAVENEIFPSIKNKIQREQAKDNVTRTYTMYFNRAKEALKKWAPEIKSFKGIPKAQAEKYIQKLTEILKKADIAHPEIHPFNYGLKDIVPSMVVSILNGEIDITFNSEEQTDETFKYVPTDIQDTNQLKEELTGKRSEPNSGFNGIEGRDNYNEESENKNYSVLNSIIVNFDKHFGWSRVYSGINKTRIPIYTQQPFQQRTIGGKKKQPSHEDKYAKKLLTFIQQRNPKLYQKILTKGGSFLHSKHTKTLDKLLIEYLKSK
jgi:hypothetical protein